MIDAHLASQLVALGRSDEALPLLQTAAPKLETSPTAEPEWAVGGLVALAEAELATGDSASALAHARRAVTRAEAWEGEPLASTPRAWFVLARALGASGIEPERARSLARRARDPLAP